MIISDKINKVIIDKCNIYDNKKFGIHRRIVAERARLPILFLNTDGQDIQDLLKNQNGIADSSLQCAAGIMPAERAQLLPARCRQHTGITARE